MTYTHAKPDALLADYVDSFWTLHNPSGSGKEAIILPDGRIDLFLSVSAAEPFHLSLLGLDTQPSHTVITPGTLMFAISFNPLAVEYILQQPVPDLLDRACILPEGYWGFHETDLQSFDAFCKKATHSIKERLPATPDPRKLKLFSLIRASNGAATVKELSDNVGWSSRQINRYFTQQYGLSLKAYCSILRFRASFPHIKKGRLFPEQHFSDQAHFIREVKKLSGTIPKELHKNKNDRFIQFSTLPPT